MNITSRWSLRGKIMRTWTMRSPAIALTSAAIVSLGLTGCGGSDNSQTPNPPASTDLASGPATPKKCDELNGLVIPATSIGLPTTGGLVTSTTLVAAAGTGAAAIGEYCKVLGAINPVDPTAPQIKFQVDLPTTWNKKAMAFGGGGFDGSIPAVGGNVGIGPTNQPVPLGRGYATWGSDSGHQANALGSQDFSFGLNDEAVQNFGGDQIKKTRDAAVFIIKARYGQQPGRSYFHGWVDGRA